MTKGKAVFGLVVVLALAGGAARSGMFGDPERTGEMVSAAQMGLG